MFSHLYTVTTMLATVVAVSTTSPVDAGPGEHHSEGEVPAVCDLDKS